MVAGFWTLDLTTITGQSAFILRHHTAAVSSYDCTVSRDLADVLTRTLAMDEHRCKPNCRDLSRCKDDPPGG